MSETRSADGDAQFGVGQPGRTELRRRDFADAISPAVKRLDIKNSSPGSTSYTSSPETG
ncbi:hypothetical protein [Streptomyces sp. P9-A2]|uniref:hypothetical protein n=1 Tax=Streptomyces sp. P9-A2 TaxID=3072284 RepID=UPI002FC5D70D